MKRSIHATILSLFGGARLSRVNSELLRRKRARRTGATNDQSSSEGIKLTLKANPNAAMAQMPANCQSGKTGGGWFERRRQGLTQEHTEYNQQGRGELEKSLDGESGQSN